ncbi:MAG TPA: hypothetical protein VKA44_08085 [Gemmatimonadota bacterium]|nr:hypothetical protein [Gemmatimonadota bacterium]
MKADRWEKKTMRPRARLPQRAASLLGGLALGVLVACGNLTAGGATGRTTVYVAGDAPDSSAAPAPGRVGAAPPGAAFSSQGEGGGEQPEGELELEFLLSLVTADGRVVSLSKDAAHLHVQFPGTQEQEAVSRSVPADDYSALRVTFTKIDAEVDAGLIVGGITITGPVEVELEGDSLVVDRPIGLDLRDGTSADLIVDMNASAWLSAVDPDLQVVSGAIVSQMIEVRRR